MFNRLRDQLQAARTRAALRHLDDRLLTDAGLTSYDVRTEVSDRYLNLAFHQRQHI